MADPFNKSTAVKHETGFDTTSLKDKSVLVTGGASGLGEEMTRQFVKAGAFVTIGDLSTENGNKLISELGEDKVAFAHCDVTSWSSQVSAFKAAIARSPSKQLDIVVANAGISGPDAVWRDDAEGDEPVEPDLRILNTNIIGVTYTAKLAIHYLARNKPGSDRCLIMTASLAGYLDLPGSPQYNAAKFGVRGLMRALRRTGPATDMRVNIIAPWFIQTRIMTEQVVEVLTGKGIIFARKEDAGAAVLHLASDRSINGRALTVVPREVVPQGYYDMEADDFNGDDLFSEWQDILVTGRKPTTWTAPAPQAK